jgi:molecular chaperone GrpE
MRFWRRKNMNTDKPTADTNPQGQSPHDSDIPMDDHAEMDDSQDTGSDDLARLANELEEARQRTIRLMADFQNYQRRAFLNEECARVEGAAKVVSAVVGIVDHFDMAMNQDPAKASAQQIIDGVKVIREELLKVLHQQGVRIIRPEPNDEFKPGMHEAIMQQEADGVEPGRVVATFQAGYLLATGGGSGGGGGSSGGGERVLRPAKVSVSPTS